MCSNSRVISACELALGSLIVIGHNVFHIVPNEVPILFVLGLVSVRARDGRWSAIGFKRLAHGFIDTYAVIVVFFGRATG